MLKFQFSESSSGFFLYDESEKNDRNITITAQRTKQIVQFLNKETNILKFDLYGSDIDIENLKLIVDALKRNDTIQYVRFAFSTIDDNGAIFIADMIRVNKSIKELHLWSNDIGNMGAMALIEAMRYNDTIATLYMEHNLIDENIKEYAYKNMYKGNEYIYLKSKYPYYQFYVTVERIKRKRVANRTIDEIVNTITRSKRVVKL